MERKEEAVEYSLFTKLAAEFFGTAILMIFGNGSVANVELKNTKGHHAGWLNIAMGYGFGVMFPVLMFGGVSGAHINPAMTLAQAINGLFPWSDVLPYIVAQLLGALLGQFIVYLTYYPHYKETEDAEAILGTFCTTDADNDKFIRPAQRRHIHPKSAPDPHRFLPRCPPAASRRRRSAR